MAAAFSVAERAGSGGPDKAPGASLEVPDEVLEIARRLEEHGHQAWCVGGAIRDAILSRPHADFDLATSARPEEVQRLFRRTVPVGIQFGTVGVLDRRGKLHEVTTFRRDVSTDGRRAVVAYGVSLEQDLARRDFTINAIAYHPLTHQWRDPFRGRDDLERGVVRAVGEPYDRFREDYLRILRCVRFAARFGFAVEEATWSAAREASGGLSGLSAERVRDEWFKGLAGAQSVLRFTTLWREAGVDHVWTPELLPGAELDRIPALARPSVERDPILFTVLLCRNAALVLERLRASRAQIGRAEAMERGPAEPGGSGEVAVRRWLSATGPAADDLSALWELRHDAPPPWAGVARNIRARRDPLTRGDLALTGTDLLEAGIPRGPELGRMLDYLLERVLEDPSLNQRNRLLALTAKRPT